MTLPTDGHEKTAGKRFFYTCIPTPIYGCVYTRQISAGYFGNLDPFDRKVFGCLYKIYILYIKPEIERVMYISNEHLSAHCCNNRL